LRKEEEATWAALIEDLPPGSELAEELASAYECDFLSKVLKY
jgi:hypothetical protein